jgi:hypothetical protein
MDSKQEQLALECKRQTENCLYTSTSLFIWLRWLRYLRIAFVAMPLILGSIAGWKLLASADLQSVKVLVAVCALLAGLLPSIYAALKYDDQLEHCKQLTGEFKNLRDRFRQAALVSSLKTFEEFETDFQKLMDRLEAARAHSYTAPEWCFRLAQRKIKSGDYDYDVDAKEQA